MVSVNIRKFSAAVRASDMARPRKVDLLPSDLRQWLKEELKERGFGGYEDLTEALNFRLEEAGRELRIGKSAVHAFGQEYEAFAKIQEEAGAWAQGWMSENGLAEEAERHNVLFQMLTTLAFKQMKGQMEKDASEIDPKELHFMGRMMKDVMASSGLREKLIEDERKAQAAKIDTAVAAGDIDAAAAQKAREIMGFA